MSGEISNFASYDLIKNRKINEMADIDLEYLKDKKYSKNDYYGILN